MTAKLLVIDNYDSFTYNLVQMFRCYELAIEVHRADKISIEQVEGFRPDYLLISPGPKDPAHAGISREGSCSAGSMLNPLVSGSSFA